MPIAQATPTISSVPTIACANPPPVSPRGTDDLVKKFQSMDPAPFVTSITRMAASGTIARAAAP